MTYLGKETQKHITFCKKHNRETEHYVNGPCTICTVDRQAGKRKDPEYRKVELEQNAARRRRSPWVTAAAQIRHKAKKLNVPFDLDAAYLESIWTNECPVLGWDFVHIEYEAGVYNSGGPQSPSIDRIDPTKGYVKGNVRWISRLANTLKQDQTDPEIFWKLYKDAEKLFGRGTQTEHSA